MSMVNGKWLTRPEREERIALILKRLETLLAVYQSGDATEYHVDMLLQDKAELKRLKRMHRAELDVAYFSAAYLSDAENPENEDNIIRNADDGTPHESLENMAPIHREFFDLCDFVDHEKRDANLGIAAPRGHSKSGIFSNCFVLHQTVYRKRQYTIIISETDNLSKKLVSWANKQLKYNKLLREDFGELLDPQSTRNEKDNEDVFITSTNIRVEASSAGKQLRGMRHGALRPSCIILDDISSINNEGTKEAREKLIDWLNAVVLPMGSKSTCIVFVGTMVSSSGALNHVLNRKDFIPSFHDAILQEPDYPELWEEYAQVYKKAETMVEVDEFYAKNEAALNSGCQVAWEWRWTFRDLMHEKANGGTKNFNSEYRNRAYSEDEMYFDINNFAYYRYKTDEYANRFVLFEGTEYRLSDMTISGSWDIAMGKAARGCFNSVVTVGRHEPSGYIFVLDEYSSREQPHIFIDRIVERIKMYGHQVFSVETINAQHEFYRQLGERLRQEGVYSTRVQDIKSHKSSKEQRIESLEPYTANKTMIFNEGHKILLEQMQGYPNSTDYVDAIDALQMAVENVARAKRSIIEKPIWL